MIGDRPPHVPAYADLPRDSTGAPIGWGVFGQHDDVGRMNLQSADAVRAAASSVTRGTVFPLNAPHDLLDPPLFGRGKVRHTRMALRGGAAFDDVYDNYYPQVSSQWDALSHEAYQPDAFYLGVTAAEILSGERNGIDVKRITTSLGTRPDDSILEPYTLAMAHRATILGPHALEQAAAGLHAVSANYAAWFTDLDLILSPVLRQEPVPLNTITGMVPIPDLTQRLAAYIGCTPLHNIVGAPAMSVPLHWTPTGLPIGAHIAARAGDDRSLLELAYELEQAQPWAHRRPPIQTHA
jgi:hypothetical protein